jgi:hypothetical protein
MAVGRVSSPQKKIIAPAGIQGTLKTKKRRAHTWLVGSSAAKKYQGRSDFFLRFFVVFFNSPHWETPKNVRKQNRKKIGFGFLTDVLVKMFRHDLCLQFFFGRVFELPSLNFVL